MEEETARVAQGQVPQMEPFVMTQKDALPPSINAIFSPPQNFISAPVDDSKNLNGSSQPSQEPPMPLPVEDIRMGLPQDYDSDEGVGADIGVEKGDETPEATAHPTDEEVDAALAELDSIPDGGCDAGEVDDDDEDDEEWSYYKMEPQTHAQNEDLIAPGASEVPVDNLSGDVADLPQSPPSTPEGLSFVKPASPTGSPVAPSSPRTVEGFVTSVELNTPEESYNTNLAINQSTEYFNGGQIEQSSGPFSVYVSSSPEPASIESLPVNINSSMTTPNVSSNPLDEPEAEPMNDFLRDEIDEPQIEASVEIVHAQSTVEVITDSLIEIDQSNKENEYPIPDIMAQSITGDLPFEPYISSTSVEDTIRLLEQAKQPEEMIQSFSGLQFSEQADALESHVEEQRDAVQENVFESRIEEQMDTLESHVEEAANTFEEFKENITAVEFIEDDKLDISTPVADILEDYNSVEETVELLPSEPEPETEPQIESTSNVVELVAHETPEFIETKFSEHINKAFEAPLDQMTASFHEDRTQITGLISSSEIHATTQPEPEPELEPQPEIVEEQPRVEAPTANLLDPAMEELAQEVSQMQVNEEVKEEVPSPVHTPVAAAKPEVKKPSSAPRTTLSRPAPPKPSPRSVGSKVSATSTTGVKGAPKKLSTLSSAAPASKPLRKVDPAKPSSTPTSATKKPSSTTTTPNRTSATSSARSATLKPSTTTTAAATASSTAAKTRSLTRTAAPPTRTKPVPSTTAAKTSTTSAPRSRSTASTTTTSATTRRVASAPRTTPSSTTTTKSSTRVGSASRIPNGATSTTTTKPSTRTTTTTKKPLATTTTTSSTRLISAPSATRKPLTASTRTTTSTTSTSTLKQRQSLGGGSTATKDNKNSTNRMLSTTKTTTATKSTPLTVSRTTTTTMARHTPLKSTTKTTGLKTKKDAAEKGTAKAKLDESGLSNGENKIVEEESMVEVKEKMEEEVKEETTVVEETLIQDVTIEHLISGKQENVLVNGDH